MWVNPVLVKKEEPCILSKKRKEKDKNWGERWESKHLAQRMEIGWGWQYGRRQIFNSWNKMWSQQSQRMFCVLTLPNMCILDHSMKTKDLEVSLKDQHKVSPGKWPFFLIENKMKATGFISLHVFLSYLFLTFIEEKIEANWSGKVGFLTQLVRKYSEITRKGFLVNCNLKSLMSSALYTSCRRRLYKFLCMAMV